MIWTSNMFQTVVNRNAKGKGLLDLLKVRLNEESQKSYLCEIMWEIYVVSENGTHGVHYQQPKKHEHIINLHLF